MKCKNFLIRKKNYTAYFYCKCKRQVITLNECKNCSDFILKRNKGIRKVSTKRKFVSKETYNKVFKRDNGKCRLCGDTNIQLHHIFYRSERKDLIDDPNNCIMLCVKCHQVVHSNKDYWQPKLLEKIGGTNKHE